MTAVHMVPIGPRPNEWYWLADGCRCGRKAQLRARLAGQERDIDMLIYECKRCSVWLATAYDMASLERAMVMKDAAWRETHAAAWAQITYPAVTNIHRGYRCRPDGRRYRLGAIGAWLRRAWTGRDD